MIILLDAEVRSHGPLTVRLFGSATDAEAEAINTLPAVGTNVKVAVYGTSLLVLGVIAPEA